MVATGLQAAFSGCTTVADLSESGTIFIAYTRPQREMTMAHELRAKGIAVYLPTVQKSYPVKRSNGTTRKIVKEVPYFSRYLAFAGDSEARCEAYGSEHKSGIIDTPNQARLIRELKIIETAIEHDPALEQFAELPQGCKCRVKAGPWLGKEGILITRRPHGQNFLIYIEAFGQSAVPLEIDPAYLEPI